MQTLMIKYFEEVKSLNQARNDIQIVEKNQKLTVQSVYLKKSKQFVKVIYANSRNEVVQKG